MPWTQADIDALKAARKRGLKNVTMPDGRSVTFQNDDQMRLLQQEMEAEVANSGGSTSEGRSTLAVFSRE